MRSERQSFGEMPCAPRSHVAARSAGLPPRAPPSASADPGILDPTTATRETEREIAVGGVHAYAVAPRASTSALRNPPPRRSRA
jgi:hypothetical protein